MGLIAPSQQKLRAGILSRLRFPLIVAKLSVASERTQRFFGYRPNFDQDGVVHDSLLYSVMSYQSTVRTRRCEYMAAVRQYAKIFIVDKNGYTHCSI